MEQNVDKDYKVVIASNVEDEDDTVILTAEKIKNISESWVYNALSHFDKGGTQYSVSFNEESTSTAVSSIDELQKLAKNAQSDIAKILQINAIVRQASNEDDIIGKVHESVEANLNSDVKFSFENLPDGYDEQLRLKAEGIIKRFHREVNIDEIMTNAITSTYDEGNCILYLRSRKHGKLYHHVIDKYPLGIALISDYSENGLPYVLIDTSELTNRLQKTTLKNKKNKPLFFKNTVDEIKNNYPKEVYDAYVARERYAKLDVRRTGVNRFGNMNRKYGLTPIFKAIKPKLMLDTFDKSDATNAKAKAKKIIAQYLHKELLGKDGDRKGLEDMAYAHMNLVEAFKNPTVLYTPPPSVSKIEYVEPKVETTNEKTVNQYRSRVTSALGISFLNTDGEQTVSTANISIKQLMRTINKIAQRQETILQRWYEIILCEENIPIEYCPTPRILDAELLEMEMKQDLAEFLFSKLNCSFQTAYETLGISFKDEMEKRQNENDNCVDMVFVPHATSYNSSGDSEGGRPFGTTNGDNEVNDKKQEYDKNRNNQ